MKEVTVSKKTLRNFLIHYQGLGEPQYHADADGVLAYVSKVGCIQYDPLNVVGRNADLVLQSRIMNYRPAHLAQALYEERTLVDGWDKMMAIYPTHDWHAHRRIREERAALNTQWFLRRNAQVVLEYLEDVTHHIRQNGPSKPGDLDLGTLEKSTWGHGRIAGAAMDQLFQTGILGVHSKNNTQKVYDLMERLLPEHIACGTDPFPTQETFMKWYVLRRINSFGAYWNKSGGGWLGCFLENKGERSIAIEALLEQGTLTRFSVEGIKEGFYVETARLPLLLDPPPAPPRAHILAPLDNLLWDRGLLDELFHFSYTWEVYVPKKKRQYGYYVLPVLYKDRFVARFEPELYRGEPTMKIKKWWWEEGLTVTEELMEAVAACLERFCCYLGAKSISKASMRRIKKDIRIPSSQNQMVENS